MWRRRSSNPEDAPAVCARRPDLAWLFVAGLTAAALGCGRHQDSAPENVTHSTRGLTLVSFALDGATPRKGGSGPDLEEAIHTLAAARPDLLAIQYSFPGVLPSAFAASIQQVVPDLAHAEILTAGQGGAALLLLSRFPVVTRRSDSNLSYRMGDQQHHLDPGILDVDVVAASQVLVRVVVARLKDKVFHVSGQTEMRRNEARMLARRLRRDGNDGHLVVAATINDTPDSAPVRELADQDDLPLTTLRPVDANGDTWTWRDPALDRYERSDYVLVSTGLTSTTPAGMVELLDTPALRTVSSHRAIVVRFPATENQGEEGGSEPRP